MLFSRALYAAQVKPVAEPAPSLPRSKWDSAATVPPIPWRYNNWRVNWRLFFFGPRKGEVLPPFSPRID